MTNRCRWCRDPIRDTTFEPFCSAHCRAQLHAHKHGLPSTPEGWNGQTRYAVQLPLPLVWREVCLLCGRDRWLRMLMTDLRRPGPCPTCRGFRVVELDIGSMYRPDTAIVPRLAAETVDPLDGPRGARPGVDWEGVA